MHTIFVRSGQSTALFSVLSSCLKMASDRAKWSNDVHSHISGTQRVTTTPFCAGTQAFVPEQQVWTALYTKGAFQTSQLTNRTGHFKNEKGFFKSYSLLAFLKHEFM